MSSPKTYDCVCMEDYDLSYSQCSIKHGYGVYKSNFKKGKRYILQIFDLGYYHTLNIIQEDGEKFFITEENFEKYFLLLDEYRDVIINEITS